MSMMIRRGFLTVALSLAGCGSVWVDQAHTPRRGVVAGALEVEMRSEGMLEGELRIVEQAPGQGFVVDPQHDGLRRLVHAHGDAAGGEGRFGAPCVGEGCLVPSDAELGATSGAEVMVEASIAAGSSFGGPAAVPGTATASVSAADVGATAASGLSSAEERTSAVSAMAAGVARS